MFEAELETVEGLLKLPTRTAGVKFLKKEEELPKRPMVQPHNFCQLISIARYQEMGNVWVAGKAVCAIGAACLGLIKTPENFTAGRAPTGRYTRDENAGKRFIANVFKIGDTDERFAGVFVHSLRKMKEADVAIIYGMPAQIMRLIHAFAYDSGEKVTGDTVAEAALCSATAFAFKTRKPIFAIPCAGDRRFGGTQHTEMLFAMPASEIKRVAENLVATEKLGASVFPVAPFAFYEPKMSEAYSMKKEYLGEEK
ncbi:MAG: DUF169 domain-containing protein [Thermoplasmata archaeon]